MTTLYLSDILVAVVVGVCCVAIALFWIGARK